MIWLDSAATTFRKPPEVAEAVSRAMMELSTPGRGGYPAAMRASETALNCREEISALFHFPRPERVVLTMNATHALNLAIKSLIPPGGRAVISGYEHNAVTRPLAALGAEVRIAEAPLFQPEAVLAAFEKLVTPDIHAVICCHVSNVFGFVQPVEEIAALCRRRGVPLIVDASQSAGTLPIDWMRICPAFLAMPGHKGLYGPQGTGALLCGEDAAIRTLLEGGTGSQSLSRKMPEYLPDRLESGTPNMPGIAGLLEGVRYVRQRGVARIGAGERRLAQMAARGLGEIPEIRVYSALDAPCQTAVVSFTTSRMDVEALGEALGERGIAVRAGLHCAPLAHRTAGTLDTGTVRVSVSDFNTAEEIDRFLSAVRIVLE